MGESGENNQWWYRDAVKLLESNGIGWAWWTWKKMARSSFSEFSGPSSYNIEVSDGYVDLINYWEDPIGTEKPNSAFVFDVMMNVANNVLLNNTLRKDTVINALTAHVLHPCEGITEVPDTSVSVRIEAEYYCEVDGFLTDPTADDGGGANIGFTDVGDWATYKISVPVAGRYKVVYRYASEPGGDGLQLELEDGNVLSTIDILPSTADWQVWQSISDEVDLPAGTYKLVVNAIGAGWNLNWLELTLL